MVPLLIGNIGPGAGEGSRLAVGATIFGGMLISTFFTLYVTPTMYVLLTKNTKRIDAVDLQLSKELKKIIYLFLSKLFLQLLVTDSL